MLLQFYIKDLSFSLSLTHTHTHTSHFSYNFRINNYSWSWSVQQICWTNCYQPDESTIRI